LTDRDFFAAVYLCSIKNIEDRTSFFLAQKDPDPAFLDPSYFFARRFSCFTDSI
jgi:hypothetical protein